MIPIVDSNGNKISGLKRDYTGAIVVDDSIALNKHKAAHNLEKRVAATEKKVDEIHTMLQKMLQHINTSEN